jgi:hypothetical protein
MEHKSARGLATRAKAGFRRSKKPEDKMKALEVAAIAQALGIRAGGLDQAKRIEGQVRGEMAEDDRQGDALRGQRALERARQIRALKNLEIFRPPEPKPKQKEAPAVESPAPKEGLQAYEDLGEGEEYGYIEDPLRRRNSIFNRDRLA